MGKASTYTATAAPGSPAAAVSIAAADITRAIEDSSTEDSSTEDSSTEDSSTEDSSSEESPLKDEISFLTRPQLDVALRGGIRMRSRMVQYGEGLLRYRKPVDRSARDRGRVALRRRPEH